MLGSFEVAGTRGAGFSTLPLVHRPNSCHRQRSAKLPGATNMQGRVETLFTYPIKGLRARPLESVDLTVGQGFPGDQLFGFAKANSGFDPDDPKPLPKTSFIVLAQYAKLAGLDTSFDGSTGEFVARSRDGGTLRFDLSIEDGKRLVAGFLTRLLGLSDAERPQFVEGSPHRFTDVSVVSEIMMNAV